MRKMHLSTLLPEMLAVLKSDTSERYILTQKVLSSFVVFGLVLEEYLHLVVPVLVGLFSHPDHVVVKTSVEVIGSLCAQVNFRDHSSRILLPLARLFGSGLGVESAALNTVIALASQMGLDFKLFIPLIDKVFRLDYLTSNI